MNYRISELMDGYNDDEIDLEDKQVVTAERIRALTMSRLPGQVTPIRRGRRLWRTMLVAAVCVLALTATALAVYQYTIKDTIMEDLPSPAYLNQTESVTEMSLVGFSDSPEYQAYVEWETWYRTWEAENPDWFNEQGVDDAWHETPDNYLYYGAYNQEQADKLDEITGKYGLALHTDSQWGQKQTQLCAALDMDSIFGDELNMMEFYIYEDGAFHTYCSTDMTGTETSVSIYVSVNGTFTDMGVIMPDSYEEWSYTTASGREVLMASSDDRSWVVANLEGCFVYASFSGVTDKAQAEALVENIDLEALNTRFATESARQQAAQAVSDWVARRQTDVVTDNTSDEGAIAMQILGNYVITDLPEGSYLWQTSGTVKQVAQARNEYFGADDWYECYSVTNYYEVSGMGEIYLYFRSLRDGETELEHDQSLEAMGEVQTDDTVNGYPAIVTTYNVGTDMQWYSIQWLDTDRELVFEVSGAGHPTLEEVKTWAQAVTAVEPELETGTAAYERRAEEHQDEIDPLVDATLAQYQADAEAMDQELERCLALIGDYSITAGVTFVSACADFADGQVWDPETEESIGTVTSLHKVYSCSNGIVSSVSMTYQMCRSDAGESVARQEYEYGYNSNQAETEWGFNQLVDCQVGSYEAYLATTADDDVMLYQLCWLDTDRDLVFQIDGCCSNTYALEDVLAQFITLAESVQ